MRETDSADEANRKRLATPVMLFLAVFGAALTIEEGLSRASPNFVIASAIIMVASLQFILCARVGVSTRIPLQAALVAMTIAIILFDSVDAAEIRPRSWSFAVLVLDAYLVFNCPGHVSILALLLSYIALDRVEAGARFGLYDLVASPDIPLVCDCSNPPCAEGAIASVLNWVAVATILLGDFHLTRGFATSLRHQLRRVSAATEVAAEIAAALARYDVDGAEGAILAGNDLPEELASSYTKLLFNLKAYKAYLPHSCLVPDSISSTQAPSNDSFVSDSPASGIRVVAFGTPSVDRVVRFPDGSDGTPTTMSFTSKKASSDRTDSIRSDSPAVPERPSSAPKAHPRRTRVSLAAGNRLGYLSDISDLSAASNAEWIAADVDCWCAAVIQARGIVDLMSGDRRYASFNARNMCDAHANAAVEVLFSRGHGDWSGCVVTGPAVCGDFGSTSVLRFMVLGGLASSLYPFERLAARWRIKGLIDEKVQSSACFTWEEELLGAVFIQKRGNAALMIYSITGRKGLHGAPDEWMYELARIGDGKHGEANRIREEAIQDKLATKLSSPTEAEMTSVPDDRKEGLVWYLGEVELASYESVQPQ